MEMFQFEITSMEFRDSLAEVYSEDFWDLAVPLENKVMLGMSGVKRTPGIKCVHMCPGGGEKAEGMSRLSLPRLFVTLFVCLVASCKKYIHTPRQSVKEAYRVRPTYTYYTGI